jgi:hypothetical protein
MSDSAEALWTAAAKLPLLHLKFALFFQKLSFIPKGQSGSFAAAVQKRFAHAKRNIHEYRGY